MTQLLTSRDAGRLLGLTPSGVRRLGDAGQLQFTCDSSRRRLFDPRHVLRLAARRKRARGAREGADVERTRRADAAGDGGR